MRQIVFDLETTGFKFSEGHRIVEIGAIELMRGAVTSRSFHTYVNPQRDMPHGAYKVHGLSEQFLKDKPLFADPNVAKAFLDFIEDAELIAHNGAGFDLPFLNAELKAAKLPLIENNLVDTLFMARRKFPGAPANLDALCGRFGVDTKQRERDGHGALLDSRLLAEVYIHLTGGAQAGLDFQNRDEGGSSQNRAVSKPAAKRSAALAGLLTEKENEAHQDFIASFEEESLWSKLGKQPR